MNQHFVPMLLGFLLLGGASHVTTVHRPAKGAQTAAPAQPSAPMPRQLRTLDEGAESMQSIEPLPVYVPEAGQSCESSRSWST